MQLRESCDRRPRAEASATSGWVHIGRLEGWFNRGRHGDGEDMPRSSTWAGSGLEAPLEDMAWGMQRKPAEDSKGLQWWGLQGQTGTADREGTLLLSAQVAR